jgi:hypothetical protein
MGAKIQISCMGNWGSDSMNGTPGALPLIWLLLALGPECEKTVVKRLTNTE